MDFFLGFFHLRGFQFLEQLHKVFLRQRLLRVTHRISTLANIRNSPQLVRVVQNHEVAGNQLVGGREVALEEYAPRFHHLAVLPNLHTAVAGEALIGEAIPGVADGDKAAAEISLEFFISDHSPQSSPGSGFLFLGRGQSLP